MDTYESNIITKACVLHDLEGIALIKARRLVSELASVLEATSDIGAFCKTMNRLVAEVHGAYGNVKTARRELFEAVEAYDSSEE